MDFNFPFLDVLVLPVGATSGERIEINGTDGYIAIYDSSDLLVALINTDGVAVSDGNWVGTLPNLSPNGEYAAMQAGSGLIIFRDDTFTSQSGGDIQASRITEAGDDLDRLLIRSPKRAALPAGVRSELRLEHLDDGSTNGVRRARFVIDELRLQDSQSTSTIPRGLVGIFQDTTNDGPHTGDTVTDMVVNNVPVIDGHWYAIDLDTIATLSATPSRWDLVARVNGTQVGRFDVVDETPSIVSGRVVWQASATQETDDFDVFADEVSGAGDITLAADGDDPRTLTITDLGVIPS